MKKSISALLFLFAMIFLANCSGNKEEKEQASQETAASTAESENTSSTSSEPANMAEAMKQAQDAMKNINGGEEVKTVNFRSLQELLPESLGGYSRTSKSGQSTGALGMNVSVAEANYKSGDRSVKMTITDTGGLGMAMMGIAAWSTMEVDKEDENGYERTGKMGSYKSYEKFRKNGSSELAVIVASRFILTANGRTNGSDSDMDDLKKLVEAVDLDKLAGMK
ncbi:MAG: hypothetical protein K9J37_17960 [Saprospiraceae bacterium]|nr:hypothetical protein [Saprospiraceae bacterium]MCF8251804.1 hypothetical protein [Saprospiraceae bacterium]MCF8281458.1 hypothetical protein [Bacteroidales bacterium]MCF8313518.1 hypothetical protein [Saprospiraceae bacterium]MCF8442259.1 hypothetical protein [Saprospiraceae bacterium]